MTRLLLAVSLLVIAVTVTAGPASMPKTLEITGQHYGYTNNKLDLKKDNGATMTFLVVIAGDKDNKWQKDFAVLSRITVTYHQGAGDGLPVATAIRQANSKRVSAVPSTRQE